MRPTYPQGACRALQHILLGVILGLGMAAPAISSPFAYISNFVSGTVSVIDTATNTVVATIPVQTGPYGVAVRPGGTRAYVANWNSNTISVIDTVTNTVVASIPVGANPFGVSINTAATRLYVVNENASLVTIDTATNTVIATVGLGQNPRQAAVNLSGTRAYVSLFLGNQVAVVDLTTNAILTTLPVVGRPWDLVMTPAGNRVYVATGANTVTVIDTTTNTVLSTVPVGSEPVSLAVHPAGTRVYVANQSSAFVSVIDTSTDTVVASVPIPAFATAIAVTPDGSRVYAAMSSNAVAVIDTATNAVVGAPIPVGINPYGLGAFIGGPPVAQTTTFANPGAQILGTSPALTATASSGLVPTFTSTTPAVCTVTIAGVLTLVSPGTCTINANQAGNATFQAAPQVSRSFAVILNGVCGSANAATSPFVPSASLCSTGAPSLVSSLGGSYAWSCSGSNGGTPAACSAPWQSTTGSNPGPATSAVTTNGWVFAPQGNGPLQSAGFIATSGHPKSPPNLPLGVTFSHGLFDFVLTGGVPGSSAVVTIIYPGPVPAGSVYWKYGPTPAGNNCGSPAACALPHWYPFPAVIAGNVATLTITDGGLGDDDLTANGTIVDQGGPGLGGGGLQTIPTLSEWAMLLLLMAMGGLGLRAIRMRGFAHRRC